MPISTRETISTRQAFRRTAITPTYLVEDIGGPIKKDHIFFFGSWESDYLRSYQSSVSTVAPFRYTQQ